MINLNLQKGTRVEEETMKTKTCNLTDLFTKRLFDKYGIVILGPPATTGFGKTQFALRLAVEFAKAYNKVKGLPKEDAVVVFTNTIDGAKDVKFKPGYVWVLDEVNPSDQTQAIHMSENMMKVLLARRPLEPSAAVMSTWRCLRECLGSSLEMQRTQSNGSWGGSNGQSPARERPSCQAAPHPGFLAEGARGRRRRRS